MEKPSDLQPSQATSLILRLAGPSTTKAGLSTEQTEINRVIADASKGSKFYENEKRKDEEVTARIQRILKLRDQAVKGVDMGKVEQKVDRLLEAIEQERDLTQYIVHVDMDAFYANVELLEDPGLAGKPFGVGHGVLCTASYEARKFGVRSGMPGHIALKLCPELILVDLHMSLYSDMSKQIMAIFRQYDPNMLAASVDEAYLNITEFCERNDLEPDECVQRMRQRVFDETKLTVSAGVAANKMLAKICSDKNKPNGQFHLPHTPDAIKEFMHGLSIRKIPGVGRVKERLLESIGVKTCGDIYNCRGVLALLDKHFGLHSLLRVYLGIASNVVQPWVREERKSIGSERTFRAISEKEKILEKLEDIAAELEDDMERGGWTGRTVTLKYKLDTYEVFTRAKTLNRWVKTKSELYEAGRELLQPEWPLRIRLIGLRVTKLKDLRKKDDGIAKFFEPLPDSKSPSKSRARDSDGHDSDVKELDSEDDLDYDMRDVEDELSITVAETSAAVAGECPLCTRRFSDNDELNAHVDWCLSREAIRSAQAEGDKSERKKPESRPNKGIQEWWKAPSLEGNVQNRKRKRRKLEE
ncbi:IMS-domain-containing protein [Lactarius hengduanensis]|nr:IMS-domain-containing protein [Lactarius hengduanensis]